MKYLKYFLTIFILFLTPKVFALEYNMNSKTSATLNGTKNRYLGTEIYNTGTTNTYTFGTRYNGKLSSIDTYFDYPFEANTTYTLTYNMNTEDFRNNFGGKYWWDCSDTMNASNQHTGVFTYVSSKKVKFSFTPSENTTCIRVLLGSTNLSSVAITGVSNWRLDSITLYDPDYQSGSGGGQGSTPIPSPTPNNNQDIINNQNNNTQDIINNNNQNTSDIIENNNQNTQDIINSNKENFQNCYSNLWNNGNISGDRNSIVSLNEFLQPGTYTISYNVTNSNNSNTLFQIRDDTTNLINLTLSPGNGYKTFTISSIATKFRLYQGTAYADTYTTSMSDIMLVKGTVSQPYDAFGVEHCTNKIDETTNAINQQNEYLMDNSDPNISDNEFTSLFDSVTISNPLSSLLQLPVQFINAIVNQSNSCQVVNLGTLYGTMISLPCIDIGSILGSSVWSTIDILSSIGLIAFILKQLYESITNALTLGGYMDAKKGGLGYMPPLEFLCSILTGFGGDF